MPEALRRLADQRLADADSIASDADRLRSQAAALDGLLDPLAPMSERVWVGPAAADFEAKSRSHAAQVNDQASRLNRIAAEFDERARQLRYEAASLRRAADTADAVTAAAAASPSVPTIPSGIL
jgi:methyl-accepting chemotaxis protein